MRAQRQLQLRLCSISYAFVPSWIAEMHLVISLRGLAAPPGRVRAPHRRGQAK
jgi:hypothetical protein